MTLAALLRHLAFAAGLALLSAGVRAGDDRAARDGHAERAQGARPADAEGRRRRHRRRLPGRRRRAVPVRRVLPPRPAVFPGRDRGVRGDRRGGVPGRPVRLELRGEAGDPGAGGTGGGGQRAVRARLQPALSRHRRPGLGRRGGDAGVDPVRHQRDELHRRAERAGRRRGADRGLLPGRHRGRTRAAGSSISPACCWWRGSPGSCRSTSPARASSWAMSAASSAASRWPMLGVAAGRFEAMQMSFLLVPMLLSGVLFDVAFTLVRRTLAGEPPTHAHRGHLYQVAHKSGMPAPAVALVHWLFCVLGGARLPGVHRGTRRRGSRSSRCSCCCRSLSGSASSRHWPGAPSPTPGSRPGLPFSGRCPKFTFHDPKLVQPCCRSLFVSQAAAAARWKASPSPTPTRSTGRGWC